MRNFEISDQQRVDFFHLCAKEPRLWWLAAEAANQIDAANEDPDFCGDVVFYQKLKPRLCELVGWQRQPVDDIATHEAYDLAYEIIYELVPPCRGDCQCGASCDK